MPSLADAERAGDESLGRLAEGGPGSTTFSAIFNSFGDTTEEKNENPEEISSPKRGVPAPLLRVGTGAPPPPKRGGGEVPFSLRLVAVAGEGCGLNRNGRGKCEGPGLNQAGRRVQQHRSHEHVRCGEFSGTHSSTDAVPSPARRAPAQRRSLGAPPPPSASSSSALSSSFSSPQGGGGEKGGEEEATRDTHLLPVPPPGPAPPP